MIRFLYSLARLLSWGAAAGSGSTARLGRKARNRVIMRGLGKGGLWR